MSTHDCDWQLVSVLQFFTKPHPFPKERSMLFVTANCKQDFPVSVKHHVIQIMPGAQNPRGWEGTVFRFPMTSPAILDILVSLESLLESCNESRFCLTRSAAYRHNKWHMRLRTSIPWVSGLCKPRARKEKMDLKSGMTSLPNISLTFSARKCIWPFLSFFSSFTINKYKPNTEWAQYTIRIHFSIVVHISHQQKRLSKKGRYSFALGTWH